MATPNPQYDQNIPKVNDDLATSQGGFLTNFQQLYNAFAQNHVALDGGATAGNHTKIEILSNPSGFQTDAGELSLYATPVPSQTNQLFMRYQGNTQDVQYTNYQVYSQGPIQPGQHGFFTTLPGGLIVYFGTIVFSAAALHYLYMNPFVCKQLLSVNFCTQGTIPSAGPYFDVITQREGFVTTLEGKGYSEKFTYYYLIVGKI